MGRCERGGQRLESRHPRGWNRSAVSYSPGAVLVMEAQGGARSVGGSPGVHGIRRQHQDAHDHLYSPAAIRPVNPAHPATCAAWSRVPGCARANPSAFFFTSRISARVPRASRVEHQLHRRRLDDTQGPGIVS
jgi:hypothetical protein